MFKQLPDNDSGLPGITGLLNNYFQDKIFYARKTGKINTCYQTIKNRQKTDAITRYFVLNQS